MVQVSMKYLQWLIIDFVPFKKKKKSTKTSTKTNSAEFTIFWGDSNAQH